jgi:hypothetical protein
MSSAVDDYTYLRNFHYSVQSDKVQETQWLWQQDTNSGNYDSGKLTFDLSQFANNGASTYQDWSRAHLVIPLVATINCDGAIGMDRSDFAVSMKPSYVNLINSVVLEVNNKVMMNSSNFSNIPAYFNQVVSSSRDDLNAKSYLGLNDLDTPGSWVYLTDTVPAPLTDCPKYLYGTGLCNTTALNPNELATGFGVYTNKLNVGELSNNGFYERCKKVRSLQTEAGKNNILKIEDELALKAQLKNYTKCVGATAGSGDADAGATKNLSYQSWFYTAIIKLSDICGGYFEKLGLIKGAHYVKLTIDLNCVGSMIIPYTHNATAGIPNLYFAGQTTLNWTCPVALNGKGLNITNTGAGNSRNFCLSVGIAKPPTTLISSYTGTQHSTLGSNHNLPTCRIYIPSIKMTNDAETALVAQGVSKKILFDDYFQTNYTGLTKSSQLNMVVSNSIRGAYAVLVCAYPSRTDNGIHAGVGATAKAHSVLQSPFAPIVGPVPLTQIQLNVNGQNIFTQGPQSYSWEQYVEQLKGFRSINGNEESGLSSCVMSKDDWENGNRFYLFTLNNTNIDSSANINLSLTNPTNINIDLLVFVFTKKQVVVNTLSGNFESANF